MRSFISFFYILLLAGCQMQSGTWDGNSYAETLHNDKSITPEMAASHIGKEVVVTGKVVSSYFAEAESGSPTFLNLDASFPDNKLTVVIFKNNLDALRFNRLDWENKHVEVSGKISQYTDEFGKVRPSLEIRELHQIKSL
jgi:hypothetical protein